MNNRIQNIKVSPNWLIIAYNKKNNSSSPSYHRSVASPPVYVYITYTLHRHTTKIFCNKLSELPVGRLRLYVLVLAILTASYLQNVILSNYTLISIILVLGDFRM